MPSQPGSTIPFYQVDAFTEKVFAGNPAAVCPLTEWLDDAALQNIAAENNLAETAFFVPTENDTYHLRWFTPVTEVDLCGHATLASAWVVMKILDPARTAVTFRTRSGDLGVERDGEIFGLDFPSRPARPLPITTELVDALGTEPEELWIARDVMAVFPSEQQVRALVPNMAKLAALDAFAVMVTAPGIHADFVSRFFAPAQGIPEDPVTGSAHCTLIPYWSEKLGRKRLTAQQVSKRGGDLICTDRGDRVTIAGSAALFATGVIHL